MKKSLFLPSFKFKHTITVSHCVYSLHDLGPNFQTKIFKPKFSTPKFRQKNTIVIICFSYSAFSCSEITVMEAEQMGQFWAPALAAAQRWAETLRGGCKAIPRWHQTARTGSSKRSRMRLQGATAGPPWAQVLPERYCLATTISEAAEAPAGTWKGKSERLDWSCSPQPRAEHSSASPGEPFIHIMWLVYNKT